MTNKDALLERMKNDTTYMANLLSDVPCGKCVVRTYCNTRGSVEDDNVCTIVIGRWLDEKADEVTAYNARTEKIIHATDATDKVSDKVTDTHINRPAYYNDGIEAVEYIASHKMDFFKGNVVEYIASHKMDFFKGNVVKYVTRAGIKSADTYLEDLKKARWYIDYLIEHGEGDK